MHLNKKKLRVLLSYKMLYMAYSVLAKLGVNQYTVKKPNNNSPPHPATTTTTAKPSGAQERKDSAFHYMACLCWCCRARRNKK